MTPHQILAAYRRVRTMARAVSALTRRSEGEVVEDYCRHLAAGGLEHAPAASPEAYTELVRALVRAARPAPAPPAEEENR